MAVSRAVSFSTGAVAALLLALPGIASAQGGTGKARFEQYCSSCHGTDAKGDGPLANLLTTKPIDLTQLAKKNGGKFPGTKVMREIDGRDTVRAHGASDMPVWGENFKPRGPRPTNVNEIAPRAKVQQIVTYIQSIQEK